MLARGTSAEFTTGASCLAARIRGCCKQGCAAGNLREVAPRVTSASTTPTWPPRPREVSSMRRTPRDTSGKVRSRRPLFLAAAFPTGSRFFLFWNAVSSCPPRPFLLYPRFSLCCPGPRACGFLLFGPVMLIAVCSAAFAHLGARRPFCAVLRVSCEVHQESAPAEHLRAGVLAQTDAPRFGAAGLLSFRGRRQNVLAISAPQANEKDARAAAPLCPVAYPLLLCFGPVWVRGL